MAYNHQNGNNGVPLNGYANQQQHNLAMQPQYAEEAAPPVLTGVAGMQIINEMFQRQARRLETQQQAQAQDRNTVEYTQAQLLVMQAQLQWHASRYQERAEHVTKSAETISRMQNYLGTMDAERARAVETAKILANDVNGLRQRMETSQPEKLQALSLSDMAMRVRSASAFYSPHRLPPSASPLPPPPRLLLTRRLRLPSLLPSGHRPHLP